MFCSFPNSSNCWEQCSQIQCFGPKREQQSTFSNKHCCLFSEYSMLMVLKKKPSVCCQKVLSMSASCSELDLCERWESSWRFDPSGLLLLSWFHLVSSSQLWPLFCFLKRWKREPNVCCLSHVLNRKISNDCDVAGNVLWYSWERADLFIRSWFITGVCSLSWCQGVRHHHSQQQPFKTQIVTDVLWARERWRRKRVLV